MRIYPKKYTKEEFFTFLKKINANDQIINKFLELPKFIIKNGYNYELYIDSTYYNIDNTYYKFELNYYSEELIEYLFNSKVFTDIEVSINNLSCELMNAKLIGGDCKK
jgi:hypothetical protein